MSKEVKRQSVQEIEAPTASPAVSRIHLREFLATVDLTEVQKAGFKAFVGEKTLMRPAEWEDIYKKYWDRDSRKEV